MRTMLLLSTLALAACTGGITGGGGGGGDDGGSGTPDAGSTACAAGRSYPGFGGELLEADRLQAQAGADRVRLKPFGALAAEYQRVLGLPVPTGAFATTFGKPPARFYAEPTASANTLFGAYTLAYQGCTELVAGDTRFAAAPAAATAEQVCGDLQRAFWDREPSSDEVATCAGFAIGETTAATSPADRWAYTCAAVLSAAGFLTY